MSGNSGKPPIPPRPFEFTERAVLRWLDRYFRDYFEEWVQGSRSQFNSMLEFFDDSIPWMRNDQPGCGEVEVLQKSFRMTARRFLGTSRADRMFTAAKFPEIFDVRFQPIVWRDDIELPADLRQRYREYRQRVRQYEDLVRAYRQGLSEPQQNIPQPPTPLPPSTAPNQEDISEDRQTAIKQLPQQTQPQPQPQQARPTQIGQAQQHERFVTATNGGLAASPYSAPAPSQQPQPPTQAAAASGDNRAPLYRTDAGSWLYWSIFMTDEYDSFQLFCAVKGEYVKPVEEDFNLRLPNQQSMRDNYIVIWPEDKSKRRVDKVASVRKPLDQCFFVLQSWADEVERQREHRSSGQVTAKSPSIKEYLVTWEGFVERETFPRVSRPLVQAPLEIRQRRPLEPEVSRDLSRLRSRKNAVGGAPLLLTKDEISRPQPQAATQKPTPSQKPRGGLKTHHEAYNPENL
ncbi:uncharacterized protein LY89DRAFT_734712 [Mollisia scopiformis]|uniref:Uncharacterized protein n=1 Tax=Mollisia scopiformis TaxID=149040 RepID=A0A194XA23_MOLSC|nr:uncharacterized protein LY89DRAFT_734712 [Mollisia scopiformis]KUJ16617.1 hypothetical protein LY89DRAFT_734712 [Mollisia scopiformis]